MLIRKSEAASSSTLVTDQALNVYELVIASYGQRPSELAEQYRQVNDPYFAFQFVNNLGLNDFEWRQILSGLLNHVHSNSISHEVAELISNGKIRVYQLPSMKSSGAIPFDDKKRVPVFPSIVTQYAPSPYRLEKFHSVAKAQAFVNGIQWSGSALARVASDLRMSETIQEKIIKNGSSNLEFGKQEIIKFLSEGKAVVLKVERIAATPNKKAAEELLPLRANDKPPPLAPETKNSESKPEEKKTEVNAEQNPELEKREQELKQIGVKLRSEGYVPGSDAEVHSAVQTGQVGNPRYLVSIQKNKSHDEPVGFRRPDTGRTTMWTATYDMLKKGDLSAPLLMALLGSTYEPAAEYTMFILDQGENFEQDGALTFSPTWDNMKKHCPEGLHMDDPEDPIHDKELLASVMNPGTQKSYKQTMESFWSDTEGTDKKEYVSQDINEYLADKGFSEEESDQFKARHLYRTQIGANAYFLGSGATEFTLNEKNQAAISADGIKMKGEPGKVGIPEMLTIEKNPPSIKQLQQSGRLKAIPLKGPRV